MSLTPKILIIEDEALNALLMSNQIKKLGFNVCKLASTGEEALRIFAEEKPDFVLIDIGLAGTMDGIEVAQKITETGQVRFAFLTGYSSDTISRRVQGLSPVAYFTKPIQFRQVESVLKSMFPPS